MLDEQTPTPAADDSAATPTVTPRRRRSASRPAGPPAGANQEPTVEPAPAADELPSVPDAEPHAVADADEAPVVAAAADLPAVSALDEAPVLTAAGEGDLSEVMPAGESQPESPPAAKRRRSTRAPKAAAPLIEVVETAVAVPADQPEPLSLDELPTLDDLAPTPAEPRSRRRRAKADPTSESTPAVTPGDPIEETLGELTRTGRRTRRSKVDEIEAARMLDELAAAISGQAGALEQLDAGDHRDEGNDPGAIVVADDAELADAGQSTDEEPAENESADEADGIDEADDIDEADQTGDDDIVDEGSPRRRRRRRGGRRRRRGGSGDSAEATEADSEDSDDESSDAEGADAEGADGDAEGAEPVETSGSTRRRRRRRRRGEDTTGADDDPSDVVVRVREPRRQKSSSDEVTGIDGSTRMEAKRQRRREGRAAGRRRTPILSEAEFLARRESVDRSMLIRQADDYTQIAVLEDGILVEHYVDRASAASMIGNVYLGKVQNVLPSMEAAFIDIGRGRNAVLYAGEVDWEGFGVTGGDRKMEKVFKSGQSVLVQVTKDPVGAKGARLTAHVSVPGRYVVYSPSGQLSGISRKLPEPERNRLKGILEELVGDTASVIVRTAAEGASEEELVRDVNRLKAQWEAIEKKVKAGKSPEQLYAEPDLTVRIVRDLFTEDFGTLIVDGNGKGEDAWDTVDAYVTHVAPHLKERLQHWNRDEQGDLFETHRINEQIAKALERKVFLPSGGSLIIDRTEAMTVIDVNTGKFTGTSGNLEATVTSNNLEAAEEVVRQLRLRDIGGIIVIDFIDMVLPANRDLLLRRLVECLGRDRTRHQVAEVTSLGLVQMTRKRIGTGLAEAFTVTCETCHGRGYHRHDTPVDTQAPSDGGERESGRRRR
ncbi:Rne/Rng family ribonuclease [Micropruina sp.]|uniref:Rne/Rng family ribonuclease n=1 Tax=Micropruina sp. TaxID=2737536 RepID=UPI0039E5E159